jgi:hypothetical protein
VHALGDTTALTICGRQRDDALLVLFAKETKSVLALPILLEKASAVNKSSVHPKARLWLALDHSGPQEG